MKLDKVLEDLEMLLLEDLEEFEKKLFYLNKAKAYKGQGKWLRRRVIENEVGTKKLKRMLAEYVTITNPYDRHLFQLKICRTFELSQTKFRLLVDDLPSYYGRKNEL